MHYSGRRGHHTEVVEGPLAPLEEFVALPVALEFDLGVPAQRLRRGKEIHLNGMVDDQVDRHQRIDLARVATEAGHGRPHGGQIHDGRHAGEVLHDDTRGQERDPGLLPAGLPGRDVLDIVLADLAIIAVAQRRLQAGCESKTAAA